MNSVSTENKSEQIYDCIVIGGGISGISFAHKLVRMGENVLILEKERAIGGQIRTYTSNNYPDYWVELGAHTCYNSYTHLLSIVVESELQNEILPLDKCKYMLYRDGKIKSISSQLSYFPLMLGGMRMFFTSRKGKTVKEAFKPIVGRSNYNKLFGRMFRAVICQDADGYPAEFFLKRRKDRMKDMPRKYSFRKGLLSLLNSVIEKDNLNVHTNVQVSKIDLKDGIYSINTERGETLKARNIALATNPQIAAELLNDVEPKIGELLKTISLFHSETLNIIIDKSKIDLPKLAGIIPISDEFLSVVSRDVAEHPHLRGFSFHFYGNQKNEKEKLHIICQVLGIDEKDILESSSVSHTLPSPRMQHVNIIKQIDEFRSQNQTFLLGNYFYGLSLEDCAHRSQDEFEHYKAINTDSSN